MIRCIKADTVAALFLLLPALFFASCDDTAGPTDNQSSGYTYEDEFFDPERVTEVRIEIDQDDWDELRVQRKTFIDVFGVYCTAVAPSPYQYYPAAVTIDGETVENVGVRKKGFFGSQSEIRPSLKIDFSEYDGDLRFHGIKRLTLNNNRQDLSRIKQCLCYELMDRAGLPAPRCSFVHVFVNGTDLGIYSNVEPIKKPFLRRHFSDDSGNLYEGQITDFRDDPMWLGRLEKESNEEEDDWSDVLAVVAALEEPDDTLLAELEKIVDVDAFYHHWAMEILTGHWDGYVQNTNNFYFYNDPGPGKFYFIPWGTDGTFSSRVPEQFGSWSVMAKCALAHRLYEHPEGREAYIAVLRNLIDTMWDTDEITGRIDEMHDLVVPYISGLELPLFEAVTDDVKKFITDVKTNVLAETADGPPEWNEPLQDPICLIEKGEVSATFFTTWGTIGWPNPFLTGTCTLDMDVEGIGGTPQLRGAMAGTQYNPENPLSLFMAIIMNIVLMEDGTVYGMAINFPITELYSGNEIVIDFPNSNAALVKMVQGSQEAEILGILMSGTLKLDIASPIPGSIIMGSITGPLWNFVAGWPGQ